MSLTGKMRNTRLDPLDFIRANLRLGPVTLLPEIQLYTAHPASGLRRLAELDGKRSEGTPPYWAYPWPGGVALARYILDHPDTVAGRRVLDLGAGSGIVAIAAAKAGAAEVVGVEIDRHAVAALTLNAGANGVEIAAVEADITAGPPPAVDLITAGDLFYEPVLACRVTDFLDKCLASGIEVLIGDPGRAHLPITRLHAIAEYPVPDFGQSRNGPVHNCIVFCLGPAN